MAHQSSINIPKFILSVTLLCIFHSCCTLKNYDYTVVECQEVQRDAIDASISDYNKRLLKQKRLSNVAIRVDMVDTSTDWFLVFLTPWEGDTDKFPIASLIKYQNQVPPSWIPTEYVENMGVLYAWHNPQKELTEDVILTLSKYHLVLNQDDEWVVTTGEGGLYYIFCKSNPQKYFRRVVRDWGTPLPKCNCRQ